MATYKTDDGVKVKAVQLEADGKDAAAGNWEITFPDGEVRYMHDALFNDNFKKV